MPSRIDSTSPNVTASTKPQSSFTRLSKVVRLYEPTNIFTPASPIAPTTILLCSWMNASSKHIDYYARSYMKLYPQARIINVTITSAQFMLETEPNRRADIKEAVTALLSRPQEDERLLVHALSNGGGKRLYGIGSVYRTMTGKPLPAKAVIMDSAPGNPQFRRDIHALSVPARKFNWLIWLPFMLVVVILTSIVYVVVNWMPRWVWRELVWVPTEGLASGEVVDGRAVKGFVYSKEDLAIDWKNVEAYADGAERNGYRIVRKLVEGAGHVQMFKGKGGEKDYWGFIGRVWGMGIDVK